jgi:Zn-dependent oligopeptidase
MMNPLISFPLTPFNTFAFDQITNEHYLPAIEFWMAKAKEKIEEIRDSKTQATFENTIAALDMAQVELNQISSLFFNLNSAETNDEMQALAQEIAPLLSNFASDVILDDQLYQRVLAVKDVPSDAESQMLYRKTILAFERNGAKLSDEQKVRLREIDQELGRLSLQFGQNVLRETNSYELILNENDLGGLSDDFKESAKDAAEKAGKSGWLISLRSDSYLDFMKYSNRRDLREKLYFAFAARGTGEHTNNLPIIEKLVDLRRERANLLGYKSHADFILEERMAKSTERVNEFLQTLKTKALPVAKKEMEMIRAFAKEKCQIEKVEKWDMSYIMEKLRKQELNVDDEALRPYLPLDKVTQGIFQICKKLFNLEFEKRTDIPVYHDEVEAYEVKKKDGSYIAILYMDFFPRVGKRGGAWKTAYKGQYRDGNADHRPHISIVCNFNRPSKTRPALLNFQELTTYFHEFGHALHGMLAQGRFPSLSGTNVSWDFVELPSQLMENWCYEQEALNLFARHIETGEPIPVEMLESIRKQRVFLEGYATIRQLGFGMIDMAWHSLEKNEVCPDIENLEKNILKDIELLPETKKTNISSAFSHIFQGGYSAGYYSYKWSEMLEVQAFEVFEKNGIFDKETANNYEKLLKTGGSRDALELFREFTGKEPSVESLLNRLI